MATFSVAMFTLGSVQLLVADPKDLTITMAAKY
jgi:hypothetical protein